MTGARLLALAAAVLAQTASPPLEYRFTEVKSTVKLTRSGAEHRVAADEIGVPGDQVRTGWRAHAVLAVPERASRFEILPSTRVVLAGPEPGVLVVLERGRLKAIFDALTGNEERLVATPGALLAVRGTRYGVEVGADGAADLAVFDGTVEVRPRAVGFPTALVRAGQSCRYGPNEAPQPRETPKGVREESWRGGASGGGDRSGTSGSESGHVPGQTAAPQPRTPAHGQGTGGGHGGA
jgi:hypothetical protein